jgi:hypothetical protein
MPQIPLFFRIVFFGFIISWCLLNVYQSRETIFQATEFGQQVIIEYLTDLQLYMREHITQFIQSEFCKKEECKVAEVNNNYDLSHYEHECPRHRYITRFIQRSPLIIYIEQFLTQNEIEYLIKLS